MTLSNKRISLARKLAKLGHVRSARALVSRDRSGMLLVIEVVRETADVDPRSER